jgi:hypothetical protein
MFVELFVVLEMSLIFTNWVIVKIEQPENNSMDMKK